MLLFALPRKSCRSLSRWSPWKRGRVATFVGGIVAMAVVGDGASVLAAVPNKGTSPAPPSKQVTNENLFGALTLIDEIDCATPNRKPDAEAPAGASRIETVLGKPCRVLPNTGDARYFAYRIGRGKGLKPGQAYMLVVEYPDDVPRTTFMLNRGAETSRGFSTGAALGDVLFSYTDNNVESLRLPQTGRYQTWQTLFFLQDRFPGLNQPRGEGPRPDVPADGFLVVIAQAKAESDPISQGAAVSRIRLFAVPNVNALATPPKPLPKGLPARHLFWREEMSDGVIGSSKPEERGVIKDVDWFDAKARLCRFLGMDTLGKDLLEFGYNQGWDAGPTNDWYVNPPFKNRWAEIVGVAARYGLNLMPYYEYAGSVGEKGLGTQKRVLPLKKNLPYTHIEWSERFYADVTDPDTLTDATRLLDATITRYKGRASFVGAWFRPRPSHMPISFTDADLSRFNRDTSTGATVTREQLRTDPRLLNRYYEWWFGKRRDFVQNLARHLRQSVSPDAVVLLTADASEPGRSLPEPTTVLVTDDVPRWSELLKPQPGKKIVQPIALETVIARNEYLTALTRPTGTWGDWEWHHSDPQSDPAHYKNAPGALLTFTLNRAYTAASPTAFEAFRGKDGLALAYHYPLNENTLHTDLGYSVADMERAGPYSMLAEARAMAYGDPRYIGYLASNNFNRGFPQYARAFNRAFLALPALPSKLLTNASPDAEIVTRAIEAGQHGTYLSVVNVGLARKSAVFVRLPVSARPGTRVVDAASGASLTIKNGTVLVGAMEPCSLRALRVLPNR